MENAFDPAGRLASVEDWAVRATGYDTRPTASHSRANVNGTSASYAYDHSRRLTQV